MKYTFKQDIEINEYQEFIKKSELVSFMQDASWASVKDNWKSFRVGLYQEQNLIAVALVLIRNLAGGLSMAYVPRGYVIDFNNIEALKEFTNGIKALAKQEKCYMVKLDPNFCFHEDSILNLRGEEHLEIPIMLSNNHKTYHQNLLSLHYKHKGYPKAIDKTLQPRFHMMVPLVKPNLTPLTEEEFLKSFKRKMRDKIGNYHVKRGVFFEHTSDNAELDTFINILKSTEERQDIHLRNKEYFEKIMDHYKEKAVLFFGKIDLNVYLEYLKNNNGKKEDINLVCSLLEKGEPIITLSASLVIMPSNENGIRISEYLYAGNQLLANKLQVSTGLVVDICKYSIEQGCTYCNLGGIDGNLNDHLSMFKSKYNPIVMEFAGEYDLPINRFLYTPIDFCLPILKKCYHLIKK